MLFRRLYKKNKEQFSSNPNKKKWYEQWWGILSIFAIVIVCLMFFGWVLLSLVLH